MNIDENASILKYTNIALADTISNANMIAIFFLQIIMILIDQTQIVL